MIHINQTEVLKSNEYKLVEYVCTASSQRVIKSFRGHEPVDCERNARHTFDALVHLKKHYSDVLLSPEALGLEKHAVTMEFLNGLPGANQLTLTTLPAATPFFRRCYEHEIDESVLWSIEQSVHVTPRILALMNSDFPRRLGFKGDLYENLRLAGVELILADSETASAEPLGLSELILYVYLFAETVSRKQWRLRLPTVQAPVAFAYLESSQRRALLDAALEFCERNMASSPRILTAIKLARARRALSACI